MTRWWKLVLGCVICIFGDLFNHLITNQSYLLLQEKNCLNHCYKMFRHLWRLILRNKIWVWIDGKRDSFWKFHLCAGHTTIGYTTMFMRLYDHMTMSIRLYDHVYLTIWLYHHDYTTVPPWLYEHTTLINIAPNEMSLLVTT